jgi:hypothetical protein
MLENKGCGSLWQEEQLDSQEKRRSISFSYKGIPETLMVPAA